MNAFADAWSAASNVRMWIGEAERSLRDARNGWSSGVLATLFTRGYAWRARIEDATKALTQARLAWMEVAHWLQRANQACPPAPASLDEAFLTKLFGVATNPLHAKHDAVLRDLAALDRLVGYLDVMQRRHAAAR